MLCRSASEALDKYGCVSDMNEAAKHFNLELDRLCQQRRFEMDNSTIVVVDVYSIKYDLIAASSSYGFEDPFMACCGYGNVNPNITGESAEHNVCPDGLAPRISCECLGCLQNTLHPLFLAASRLQLLLQQLSLPSR